jgi:hypothetical protein
MFERSEPLSGLKGKQLKWALRKRINSYQIKNLNRFTGGKDHWAWHSRGDRKKFVYRHLVGLAERHGLEKDIFDSLMNAEPVGPEITATLIDGRWVARCECGGQEVVDPDDPVFVCLNPNCLNAMVRHNPRRVKFPNKRKMQSLAEILLARENPIHRNWLGESLDELEKENQRHNLPKRVTVREVTHGMVNAIER